MKNVKKSFATKLSALLLAVVFTVGVIPSVQVSAKDSGMQEKADRMVQLINQERAKAGVAPLKSENTLLTKAADIRAKEISTKFSHTRPNGTEPFTALTEVGLRYRTAGENIAYNSGYQDTVAQTMEGLMNSPGHRENILKESYEEVGIGLYVTGNTYYWVQMFYSGYTGNPSPSPDPKPEEKPQPYPGTPFTDISGHWGREAVKWAYQRGLFTGVTETEFRPEAPMERGMLAEVLYRLAGKPSGHTLPSFSDVPEHAYFAKAVAWAAGEGIVSGVGNNRFAPERSITREELACMLYRYAKAQGPVAPSGSLASFTDGQSVSSWAKEAAAWAVGEGILTGKGGNRLDPGGKATRAEVASMLQRFAA